MKPRANFCIKASRVAALVLVSAALGCGESTNRASITGKVTFDGQPVNAGQIIFEPQGSGRLGVAQIADGVYKMPAQQGPTAGKYVIRITANRPTGKKVAAGSRGGQTMMVDELQQFIPERYNDRSELSLEIGDEPESSNDFDLKSATK